jgi:predicted methyltransferase
MKPALWILCGICSTLALSASAAAPAKAAAPKTSAAAPAKSDAFAQKLDGVLAGEWRSDKNRARDQYRHPKQTLEFFGVNDHQTLIEIYPGGGWYAEILAPLLKDHGHYFAAILKPKQSTGEAADDNRGIRGKFKSDPERFGGAQVVEFDSMHPVLGAPGSADVVLTFRNVHNMTDEGSAQAMFKGFFDVLKPGGTLGVVDHRAAQGADPAKLKDTGYLPEAFVIKLATDAGFKLDAKSEINANPKDTKDYPKGVWTLPPTLELKDQDREKYLAIGESDRMTLKFVKPGSDKIFSAPEEKKAKK